MKRIKFNSKEKFIKNIISKNEHNIQEGQWLTNGQWLISIDESKNYLEPIVFDPVFISSPLGRWDYGEFSGDVDLPSFSNIIINATKQAKPLVRTSIFYKNNDNNCLDEVFKTDSFLYCINSEYSEIFKAYHLLASGPTSPAVATKDSGEIVGVVAPIRAIPETVNMLANGLLPRAIEQAA